MSVEISGTPGHADIKGNEYADQLAKEAAQDAKEKEDLPAVISIGDVKAAARESGTKKWQEMWEKSERGRNLYMYRPKVNHKVKHVFDSSQGERITSQLRTGYIGLNEYLHKCSFKDCDKCECGAIESVGHFLLHCPLYENARELMRQRLFEICGIAHLDLNLLLDAKYEEDFKDCRSAILSELENFVVGTKRFATR